MLRDDLQLVTNSWIRHTHYTHLVIFDRTCLVLDMLERLFMLEGWFRDFGRMLGPRERSLRGIVRSNRLRIVRGCHRF